MKKFVSKELLMAITFDFLGLYLFGMITADLNDNSLEAKIFVISFFVVLAAMNLYFFFRYKKLQQLRTIK